MNNRILLVDDEETIRYALKEALISNGYNVNVARNAFQALECFKLATYDLLITDIKMHGMDGIQLIRELKRSNSQLKVIIITAYGSLEIVKEAAELGVVDVISKPFKIQVIKDVIGKILNESSNPEYTGNEKSGKQQARDGRRLSKTDNLLKPGGLSYYFDGPAYQPKSTVIFDAFSMSSNGSALIFGNINDQDECYREWWGNWQTGIIIKTLFRSKAGNSPKGIIDSINKFLYREILPHINVSMLCVYIDKKKKIIKYVNNGNNLICSMIAPNGETEIMKFNPSPLGISPRITLIEETMPYSCENKLMLSRSNSMSRIVEKGTMIKNKIENTLQNIKGLQRKQSKEAYSNTSFTSDNNVSLDDETVLLVNLDT